MRLERLKMHESIEQMLARYRPKTTADSIKALREILQEVALVGLWRAKFFEKAAFYGGTSLRILYGLDRFSEDLDFSLLKPMDNFSLTSYNKAIQEELNAFGFDVTVSTKKKNTQTQIESAFIKANTLQELINIGYQEFTISGIAKDMTVKIKLEVDTNPPMGFKIEAKPLNEPIPISIMTYTLPDLFAGKMHALLCRMWKNRVKGRDWYDFVWFARKGVALNLDHLKERMLQSGHLQKNEDLTKKMFLTKLENTIENLDLERALMDIRPFVYDVSILDSWSKKYFKEWMNKIIFVSKDSF